MNEPRGIRNNNPGNIRHSPDRWQGRAEQQPDRSFVTFETPIYGIRAIYKILCTYQRTYKCHSIRQMIAKWAPPNENDTEAYVEAVADACDADADERVDITEDENVALNLISAIIRHENGKQPYKREDILAAIAMP